MHDELAGSNPPGRDEPFDQSRKRVVRYGEQQQVDVRAYCVCGADLDARQQRIGAAT